MEKNLSTRILVQETFRKNALGLLSVAEVAGEEGVRAVAAFERTVGAENLKLSFFRGFETLFPPDMEELIARWRFILLMGNILLYLHLLLTCMQGKMASARSITKKMKELKINRYLTFHLLHPEMGPDRIHPSRSVFSSFSLENSGFWMVLGILDANASDFLIFLSGTLGQADNILHSLSSQEHLKFHSK